jgi:hypothetical protein
LFRWFDIVTATHDRLGCFCLPGLVAFSQVITSPTQELPPIDLLQKRFRVRFISSCASNFKSCASAPRAVSVASTASLLRGLVRDVSLLPAVSSSADQKPALRSRERGLCLRRQRAEPPRCAQLPVPEWGAILSRGGQRKRFTHIGRLRLPLAQFPLRKSEAVHNGTQRARVIENCL